MADDIVRPEGRTYQPGLAGRQDLFFAFVACRANLVNNDRSTAGRSPDSCPQGLKPNIFLMLLSA